MAAKKKISTTDYVKRLPATMPAKDVVTKGKADGVRIDQDRQDHEDPRLRTSADSCTR